MGVLGDPNRTSTVVSEQPFMGLVPDDTTSWKEEEYNMTNVNTCWELYGVTDEDHFPSTGSRYDITISTTGEKFPAPWMRKWNALDENGFLRGVQYVGDAQRYGAEGDVDCGAD